VHYKGSQQTVLAPGPKAVQELAELSEEHEQSVRDFPVRARNETVCAKPQPRLQKDVAGVAERFPKTTRLPVEDS